MGKTLVVTMGGQSQVVTFATDLLLDMGEVLDEVLVLHLSPEDPRVAKALTQLSQEFAGDFYAHKRVRCRFRRRLLQEPSGKPLQDVRTEEDAEAVWLDVRDVVRQLKEEGRAMHLVIAGGRRMIGFMALSAAMLLFGHTDRAWHMFTEPDFLKRARDGAIRHDPSGEHVRLIQIPMVPWGAYFPTLRALSGVTPAEAISAQVRELDSMNIARCRQVWDRLTPRQREALLKFAEGLTPQEVAEALVITLKTVDSHKTPILDECRNAWALPPDKYIDYHFIREHFRPCVRVMRRWLEEK